MRPHRLAQVARSLLANQRHAAAHGLAHPTWGLAGIAKRAFDRWQIPAASPFRRAAYRLATQACGETALPYHNAHHTREVLVNAITLIDVSDFTARERDQIGPVIVIAALAHDLGHDGSFPRWPGDCRLEKHAAEQLANVAVRAGVPGRDVRLAVSLVLATCPSGVRLAVLSGKKAELPLKTASGCKVVFSHPRILQAAQILNDSDILSSVGLGDSWRIRQERRLAEEWNSPLRLAQRIAFLDRVVGKALASEAGRRISPAIHRLKAAYKVHSDRS